MKEDVANFLTLYKWIHSTKVTNFFPERIWEKFPSDWIKTLENLSNNEINLIPCGMIKEEWPQSLKHFLKSAVLFGSVRYNIQKYVNNKNFLKLSARGMSPKKVHEVERMGTFLKEYLIQNNCQYVVDVGSGLGYLDIALAKLGFKVIGLEIDPAKVLKANESAFNERVSDHFASISLELRNDEKSIKQLEFLVKSRFNLKEDEEAVITLVGLHCCGDLSTAIIKAFIELSCFQHLVFFGCCYHSMNTDGTNFINFPLSKKSSILKGVFNQCSLRLGSQQTRSSWMNQKPEDHRLHTLNVSFRSILESAMMTKNFQFKKLNRKLVQITDKTTFESYIDTVLCRSNLGEWDSIDGLMKMHEEFGRFDKYIEPFTILFQPIIEYSILDDRKEYIREHGYNCELTQLFEDGISPRNCAVMANKLGF